MPGTKAGSEKAMKTIRSRYGEDFFKKIGKVGGIRGKGKVKGGFNDLELASRAGRIGGSVSKRKKKEVEDEADKV